MSEKWEYDGKRFDSLRELCRELNVSYSQCYYYCKKGKPLEEIIQMCKTEGLTFERGVYVTERNVKRVTIEMDECLYNTLLEYKLSNREPISKMINNIVEAVVSLNAPNVNYLQILEENRKTFHNLLQSDEESLYWRNEYQQVYDALSTLIDFLQGFKESDSEK